MAGGEFDLIRRHFTRPSPAGMLGVGDDCALLPDTGCATAVSTDLLIEGRHFFADVDPRALGHKALAVNLSDLAAMGARPTAFVLGLALPRIDDAWLSAFAQGMFALADAHGCPLVGGDTTRSLAGVTISVTVFGAVPADGALRRAGARPGDDIWVSGPLGDADLALRLLSGDSAVPVDDRAAALAATRRALEWPAPRVALGLALRGLAHAAIDISDGLLQDLGHILAASGCGARVCADEVPVSAAVSALPPAWRRQCALAGGDVYELCFTAPPEARTRVAEAASDTGAAVTRIGTIEAASGLRVVDGAGAPLPGLPHAGFDHFA
ncbi:MAG: thiamine-phosphate kinase [Pigmentiphaga sp.]|nr:thiamine-phosphate kinase [Pigmentiphaga sp.]MDX3904799.1 thiamine-phosphate kinase [Pigmentiphaga sp.]